jgi:hypothetical protein
MSDLTFIKPAKKSLMSFIREFATSFCRIPWIGDRCAHILDIDRLTANRSGYATTAT